MRDAGEPARGRGVLGVTGESVHGGVLFLHELCERREEARGVEGRDLVFAPELFSFLVEDDPARLDEDELLQSVGLTVLLPGLHPDRDEVLVQEGAHPRPGEGARHHVAVDLHLAVHGGPVDRRDIPEEGLLLFLRLFEGAREVRPPLDRAAGSRCELGGLGADLSPGVLGGSGDGEGCDEGGVEEGAHGLDDTPRSLMGP